jgi:hypothetical protein
MGLKAALALCLALAACSSQPKPVAAPTGPYRYESTEGGVTIESTVKVRYAAAATVVDEDVQFGHVTANIESRLDPKTYSAIAYAMHNDPEGEEPSIAVSAQGALFKTNTGALVVAKAPVPGAPSWIFGNYASSFIMLPSLVRATHLQTINAYMTDVFHGKAFALRLSVVPTIAPLPAGVPARDASISLGSAKTHKPASMVTVWYDPATYVVDCVNIAGATAFVRKR